MRAARAFVVVGLVAALSSPGGAGAGDDRAKAHYEIEVRVGDGGLAVTETIRGVGARGSKLALDLVPEMKVLAAEADGRSVAWTTDEHRIELDLGNGRPAEPVVTLRLEGSPREQFSAARGGWVRSAVTPDLAYVRSQVPWYARLPDVLATYRTVVDVKAGWKVRTAGTAEPPTRNGDREVHVFRADVPEARIGLVAGPWASRELAAGDAGVFEALHRSEATEGADAILGVAKRAFDFYGAWLGTVPLSRFTLVEMPEAFGAGSGYGESGYDLLGPGAFAAPPAAFAPPLVAHEVSHTWWGQAVRFSEWPSEALASFAALKFLEADQGAEAGRSDRRSSVEEVLRAAEAGKEVALGDLRGFGAGMDPETYASHAYGKGKMLLAMIEDATGEDVLKKALARFVLDHRGKTVGWADLRAALVGSGPAAKTLVEQWERPGIPKVTLDLAKPGSGKAGRLKGTLRQEGTRKPYRMKVVVAARCGDETARATVSLEGAKASFDLAVPSEPTAVEVDPEWRLLIARPAASDVDPSKALDEAMKVVSNPSERDPGVLGDAIAKLRIVLEHGSPDVAGTCRVGIGRCLFNLERLGEARKELEEGLRLGCGPFHRGWANLRLGNIADLEKRRKEALKHYEAVVSGPAAKNLEFQKERAKRFLDRPYQGLEQDG